MGLYIGNALSPLAAEVVACVCVAVGDTKRPDDTGADEPAVARDPVPVDVTSGELASPLPLVPLVPATKRSVRYWYRYRPR
jgi:hypothetical protein